jgi:hypothetical protein
MTFSTQSKDFTVLVHICRPCQILGSSYNTQLVHFIRQHTFHRHSTFQQDLLIVITIAIWPLCRIPLAVFGSIEDAGAVCIWANRNRKRLAAAREVEVFGGESAQLA